MLSGGKHTIILYLIWIAGSISSCRKDIIYIEVPVDNTRGERISLKVPEGFPVPILPETNPLTREGVELGRKLFYDPRLSYSNKVSCATCHVQGLAFSDGTALGNNGVSGNQLHRHSPVLMNLAWMNDFFWDGGSKNLESQAFGPLTHADEMALILHLLPEKLGADSDYVAMFEKAFTDGIKTENVAKALAQFQRTIISGNSRYDQYKINLTRGLNHEEMKGLSLVKKHCGSCHSGELFTDNLYHNNGIDNDFSDESHEWMYRGRYRITHDQKDMGAYKTPSLRNIMVSAPYMHDGRFATIDDVLEHYTSGIKASPYTSKILNQNNGLAGIPLTTEDKQAIKAFLHTLTDRDFLSNPDFSRL